MKNGLLKRAIAQVITDCRLSAKCFFLPSVFLGWERNAQGSAKWRTTALPITMIGALRSVSLERRTVWCQLVSPEQIQWLCSSSLVVANCHTLLLFSQEVFKFLRVFLVETYFFDFPESRITCLSSTSKDSTKSKNWEQNLRYHSLSFDSLAKYTLT